MKDHKYNLGLRIIHWLMATFLIGMFYSGFYMKRLPVNNELKFTMYTIHKICGITVFEFAIIRVFFRIFTCTPQFSAGLSRFEITMIKVVHFVLYILMILVPLSGYVMSSASGARIKYLFFHIPLLISKNKELANAASTLHAILAYFIMFFTVLHVLAALKHTLMDKQNIFRRIV
ncbi:MAG: cytochrome b [Wolbachia endosymbiont of Meromenopon meropis]|nr:cytochrome b [Wolbachia endosymbiont of Meromenopon meropis]